MSDAIKTIRTTNECFIPLKMPVTNLLEKAKLTGKLHKCYQK